MKILFIYPNTGSQTGFNYGVSHISAVLKQAGHSVSLWHLCEEIAALPAKDQFINRLKQINPDIIGFSVVTNQWNYAKKIAGWAREAVSVPLVCGGIHVMAAGQNILQSGFFDFIVYGEAEEAFLELIEKIDKKQNTSKIKNIGFVKNGKTIINPVRPLPDLKKLPFKDYEIFDFQKIIDLKNGWVGLMASRGCPFSCSYCFNHQMVSHYKKDLDCNFKELNYIRHFNVKDIIYEINYLLANYKNIKMFIFDDDLFTFYKPYVKEFCQLYQKTCSIPFVVNAHVGFFDAERAQLLAEANCKIVKFGVESGSEKIRKSILKRHMKNDTIIKAIRIAHNFRLHTSVFLMIGLPAETREDVMATIKLIGQSKPGRFRWSFFYPFPNTKAYEISAQGKHIDYAKMTEMENFINASCLDFGEKHNLFLKKVGRIMPWFVNSCSDLPVADFYKEKVKEVMALDSLSWEKRSENILDEDKEFSLQFAKKGLSHYAIKYNSFMGVISDYFLTEI